MYAIFLPIGLILGLLFLGGLVGLAIKRRREQIQRAYQEEGIDSSKKDLAVLPKKESQKTISSDSSLGQEKQIEIPEPSATLKKGLDKTRKGFIARIAELLKQKDYDEKLLEQLEEILLTADVGVKTTQYLLDRVREKLSRSALKETQLVFDALREETLAMVDVKAGPLHFTKGVPYVILVVGVNGAGKTTTIGKLSSQFKRDGRKVLMVAGDTFRAAATQQLAIWGERTEVEVVQGKEGGDPSAIIYEGINKAQKQSVDVVLADTAGRLHVKTQLMEELQKIRRVIKKAIPEAPHQTWLVLDSTSGQNAMIQAVMFKEILDVSGVILTKLDGTSKGGIILSICHELKLPIYYVGIGEKIDDLKQFNAQEFVEALYNQSAHGIESEESR